MKLNSFRCGILRILPLLCLILGTQTVKADILKGRVLDAETREPLDGAIVSIEEVVPDFCTFSRVLQTDSLGRFHYRCSEMTRITIHADFFGYKQGVLRLVGSDGGDEPVAGSLIIVYAFAQQYPIGFGATDGHGYYEIVATSLPHGVTSHAHIIYYGS